jgi:hypothetical protein
MVAVALFYYAFSAGPHSWLLAGTVATNPDALVVVLPRMMVVVVLPTEPYVARKDARRSFKAPKSLKLRTGSLIILTTARLIIIVYYAR